MDTPTDKQIEIAREDGYIHTDEAIKLTGRSRSTLSLWARRNLVRHRYIGRYLFVYRDDVERKVREPARPSGMAAPAAADMPGNQERLDVLEGKLDALVSTVSALSDVITSIGERLAEAPRGNGAKRRRR